MRMLRQLKKSYFYVKVSTEVQCVMLQDVVFFRSKEDDVYDRKGCWAWIAL